MEDNMNFVCRDCNNEPNEKINVTRFIDKLDGFFRTNDLEEAEKHIKFWENEARKSNDSCGLLSILNEELGFFRRVDDKENGLKTVDEVLKLLEIKKLTKNVSGATIYVNVATTLKAFGKATESIPIYEKAEKIFLEENKIGFEYASLLNNKSSALCDLKEYNQAEKCLLKAIDILEKLGNHDCEIALSLISLAHIAFDRDEDYQRVEELLDKSWDYLNKDQPKDANYAYIISKCVPSLRYFKREIEADALEELAKEIYDK